MASMKRLIAAVFKTIALVALMTALGYGAMHIDPETRDLIIIQMLETLQE